MMGHLVGTNPLPVAVGSQSGHAAVVRFGRRGSSCHCGRTHAVTTDVVLNICLNILLPQNTPVFVAYNFELCPDLLLLLFGRLFLCSITCNTD